MNDSNSGEITLAFSLSAIDRLEDPSAVFDDTRTWSHAVGVVDSDTERIGRLVERHNLRQDFDVQGRDKWFVLEELCETTQTPRHVYVGASDADMRVSTLFCWEYVRVSTAAEQAGWELAEPTVDSGTVGRLVAALRGLLE